MNDGTKTFGSREKEPSTTRPMPQQKCVYKDGGIVKTHPDRRRCLLVRIVS
jgi:hypothetical protein